MESNTDKAVDAVKQGANVAADTASRVAQVLRSKVAELAAIQPSAAPEDYLHSWNDTPTRTAITEFVRRIATPGSPDFLAVAERVAVFDNDGTLWTEKPMPIQLDFTIRRFVEQATNDQSLRGQQPWKAAVEQDLAWFGTAMVKHYHGDDSDLKLLMNGMNLAFDKVSIEDYREHVDAFFASAEHPTLKRPYLKCSYAPMRELLDYLAANGFTNYIASGGDRDFMRGMADDLYGIPPERIIGSTQALEYHEGDDGVDVLYKSNVEIFDDGPVKPTRIWSRIGRRPVIAGGNSNGDIPMLRFARVEGRPSLRLLVRHDDAEREFDDENGAEEALQRAAERDWTVISIKNDWSQVFPS